MKLIHLSDLHLGKRVNGFSMLEDQTYILNQIFNLIKEEKADAVLLAGDIYDKPVPSADAVKLLDDFLTKIAGEQITVFLISGNHDSAERLAFGGRLMEQKGVHLSPVFDGKIQPVTLWDDYGAVRIYLLPFVKPVQVRHIYQLEEELSYDAAVRRVLEEVSLDTAARNVLLAHQLVTGAARCESEEISIGGLDHVDASVFAGFDYVALGHIHGAQNIGENIRYCGTPLKYSFSEAGHEKSVTVAELKEKGAIELRTIPLKPLHDLREIRGSYMDLTALPFYQGTNTEDYLHITLTDEEDIPDALNRLRVIYPNIMKMDYDNLRTRQNGEWKAPEPEVKKDMYQLFAEFYEQQNNQPMTKEQRAYLLRKIAEIKEETL